MPATALDPFADLVPPDFIGGENGAPAFQTIGAKFEQVPRASLVTPNAFADLIPSQPDPGAFQDLIPPPPPQADLTSATEQAVGESAFNPRNEQVSSAPTFMGELHSGNIQNAYRLAKEYIGQALEPTQPIEAGRGKGLLGTEEQMPADPSDSLAMRAAKAVVNVTNRTAAGLTGPGMLPLAVIGGAGGATSRLLAGAFGADIASNAPEMWQRIQEADKTEPWSQARFETGLDTVMQAAMLAGAATHAASGEPVRPSSGSDLPSVTSDAPSTVGAALVEPVATTEAARTDPGSREPVAASSAAGVERSDTATAPQTPPLSEGIPSEADYTASLPSSVADSAGQSRPVSGQIPPNSTGSLLPAIRLHDGSVITGKVGQLHADIMDVLDPSVAATLSSKDRGFTDSSGRYLDPEQAFRWAKNKGVDTSLLDSADTGYLEASELPKVNPPAPPVQPEGWQMPENIEPGATAAIAELERQLGPGENPFGQGDFADNSGYVEPQLHSVNLEQRNPLNLEAAAREPDGRVVTAKGSLFHGSLANVSDGAEMGFSDATGKFYTRDEAAKATNAEWKKKFMTSPAPEILPSRDSLEEGNDWTQATAESGFKLKNAGEGGFVTGDLLKAAGEGIDKAKEVAGLNIDGKASDLNVATTARSARLQRSFADAELAQKEIGKALKTERRQNAASVWIEAGGDKATLQTWEQAAKGKMFKRAVADAQTLTPDEIAMAQKARQTFGILETRGRNYDVLSNHRDNYVPHVWDVSKKFSGIGSSKLQDRFKFSKARSFNNFFEGDQANFTPKTLAIGKLVPAYLHEMNTVIADRQFVQDVSAGVGSDARPLLLPRGNAQAVDKGDTSTTFVNPRGFASAKDAAGNPVEQGDYTAQAGQPALSNWRFVSKDEAGNSAILKSDLATHPELTKRLNSMLGKSAVRQWYNEPSTGLSVIPKAIAKGIDTAQATMKREMFGALAPFHQVQEGTHAVGHLVNPTFGLEDMSRPTPAHIDAMQHGLMLLPEKQSSAAYIEGVGGRNTFLTQLARKFGGKVGAAAADVVDGYQNYLFHQYIPALKFKTYEHILGRNMSRYAKDIAKGEVTPADVKFLSAEQSNAAYGHLNYALLDRNPTMQHLIQIVALAPDFLEARGRFVGQAVKGFASKSGFEQFRAIATLAAIQAGSAIVISSLMGDKWDPKHPFEVTHNGRTYTLRSVPEDMFRLLFSGPDIRREFVRARVNPLTGMAWQAVTGRNYRGEKVGFMDTVGETLANYIPITARSIPFVRNLTESGRNYPVSPLEQLMGSLGLKISRYSPITKTYQLASEYKKAQGMPADTGVYPVSKYQSLRYALEDADMDRAKVEYQKLRSSGMASDKIRTGFKESIEHAFTGSKASDEKFKKSLDQEGRESYDQAISRRREILRKFGFVTR